MYCPCHDLTVLTANLCVNYEVENLHSFNLPLSIPPSSLQYLNFIPVYEHLQAPRAYFQKPKTRTKNAHNVYRVEIHVSGLQNLKRTSL